MFLMLTLVTLPCWAMGLFPLVFVVVVVQLIS
jgi:hypothetical protein